MKKHHGPAPKRERGEQVAAIAERQRHALELRRAGATYDQIAQGLGLAHRSNARKDVEAALLAIIEEPATEVLKLELDRLDSLLRAIWPAAVKKIPVVVQQGDEEEIVGLIDRQGPMIDRVLRLMERRARYLGLDKPIRVKADVDAVVRDVSSMTDEELIKLRDGDQPASRR